MPLFFWIAQAANAITASVALAAMLVVLWLGPRRWTNISFACFLSAIIIWMAPSFIARIQVNLPELGGNPTALINWAALGFSLLGITLFWFITSFYPIGRRWTLVANISGALIHTFFMILLLQDAILTDVRRDLDGGIAFGLQPIATGLAAFHYIYEGVAIFLLLRNRAWKDHLPLLLGAVVVVLTSVLAIALPGVPLQTYTITLGTLLMTYELMQQQLFNPLLQMNQRLESEVQRRTAELAQSLKAQERVRSELAAARTIQLSLLPSSTPQHPHVQVAGCSIPAKEVGGDFFAYHMFADGRLGVAVGDVSGKGIPAALLMALVLNTFETLVESYQDLGSLLTACNSSLAPRLVQSRQNSAFLSLVIGRDEVQVANAGLIAPLLWRAGEVRYVESYGLPLGAFPGAHYRQQRVQLQPGDALLLVSDGIVEAMSEGKQLWGFPQLEEAFGSVGGAEPHVVVETIVAKVHEHMGNAPQNDDMTVVALRVI
ncbi:PP2C family protein-serine/threonine phosphatase [Chloroflexia bacterium SDU3-3]|nr:PP2C family protein-serine/threonine phosphatase [Chloroflexia bacterium SDU3-3]